MTGLGLLSWAGAALLLLASASAAAAPGACRILTRDNVAECATRASPALASAAHAVSAAEGRVTAATPWLPSRPVLGLSAGRATRTGSGSALAWRAELAQELELGGQRGARGQLARAEASAHKHAASAVSRDIAASALLFYFDALAADEEARLERRAERVAERVALAAQALAERGGAPRVDADVAAVSAARATQARLDAERRGKRARTELGSLVGQTEAQVSGLLEPLPRPPRGQGDPEALPEVATLRAEQRAERARAETFRRQRVPNVSVSLFVERDGYDEQVLGGGVQIPLPVARTYSGEIREAEALALRASSRAHERTREARLRWATAALEYDARAKALAAFSPERVARAERSLEDMATEIEQQRLAARDALVAQQALLDYLRSHVAARHAVCRASVELLRASGLPVRGGAR
ncbi:MAG: TolC family protein [Polyangiaceae bacterium]|nr:TolC family protein [Polyangiaceae bacterium]MCL4756340.1 TolC family protein [Myxococcales bacterium]